VVVTGHGRNLVEEYLGAEFGDRVSFALQEQQKGTGHAALQALPKISKDCRRVLIVCGDTPLLWAKDLAELVDELDRNPRSPISILTCVLDQPKGYGRILRDSQGKILEIREDKDLKTPQERQVREVNPGVYCASLPFLQQAVEKLSPNNAQGEFYLTDVIAQARCVGGGAIGIAVDSLSLMGINDRAQLAAAEDLMFRRIADEHRRAGCTIRTGALIESSVRVGHDATIGASVEIRGNSSIGAGAYVDVGSVIVDSTIGEGALIKPYSVISSSSVGPRAQIGPFAHLRPESVIGEEAHVGNFVETKKTQMHPRSKANHLAYLGDGEVGEGANIGAGTIFCNYDGFSKHKTTIGKGAFIGSDSQMVAPVVVGENAYVGTGSTITRDVPADALAIGRARQENKEGYAVRIRSRLAAIKAQKAAEKK
jgi:bifunctional UDP-N-acetylglucosamine pyrophosphorylase/glucosamine-1-phosphate N-acetyltransferase